LKIEAMGGSLELPIGYIAPGVLGFGAIVVHSGWIRTNLRSIQAQPKPEIGAA